MNISILSDHSVIKNEKVLVCGDDFEIMTSVKAVLAKEDFRCIMNSEDTDIAAMVYCDRGAFTNKYLSLKRQFADIPVVVVSARQDVEYIVDILKMGVYDFILSDFIKQRLALILVRALERSILVKALTAGGKNIYKLKDPDKFSHIITQDEAMMEIFMYIEQLAHSTNPILVTGETGVGKELIAKAVHNVSGKKDFVALNIAGVDSVTFSDTLFGHVKGAYTGADGYREGLLSKVNDGILFLDEIGDLSEDNQLKLLRIIQEREYYKLGSDTPQEFKGRLVLATNKNLEDLVSDMKFRKDLYFRINSHHVHVPPLRNRVGDIPLLLKYFISKAAKQLNKTEPKVMPGVFDLLSEYSFPGNIRELESIVYDVVAQHKLGVVSTKAFFDKLEYEKIEISTSMYEFKFDKFPTLKEMDEYLIDYAMRISKNNQSMAASLLGISRQALNKRINK